MNHIKNDHNSYLKDIYIWIQVMTKVFLGTPKMMDDVSKSVSSISSVKSKI